MAKIVFDNGKEVVLSQETTDRLKAELVEPDETYAIGDVFWRNQASTSYYSEGVTHYFRLVHEVDALGTVRVGLRGVTCKEGFCIAALDVADPLAITRKELNSMTGYPEGLRRVKAFELTEVD